MANQLNLFGKPKKATKKINKKSSTKKTAKKATVKPTAKKRSSHKRLTKTQKQAASLYRRLQDKHLVNKHRIFTARQARDYLFGDICYPHFADDAETYAKWYQNIKPHTFYYVPKRDWSPMASQKLADQKPVQLSITKLNAYLHPQPAQTKA